MVDNYLQSEFLVQVGLDSGDGINSFVIARSRTPGIVDVHTESNSGVVGRYMFKTDMSDVIATTVEQSCQNSVISGTASIRGHQTLWAGNIEKQVNTTMENIEHLISYKNIHGHGFDCDVPLNYIA